MGLKKAGGNFYSVEYGGLMTYNQMATQIFSSISNFNAEILESEALL